MTLHMVISAPAGSSRLDRAGLELGGTAIGELRNIIDALFEIDDLEEVVSIRMNMDLASMVDLKAKRSTVIFKLLMEVNKHGCAAELLYWLWQERRDNVELRDAIERYLPKGLEEPGKRNQAEAQKIKESIGAVERKLHDPKIRNRVQPHRDALEKLMSESDRLNNYKLLHDCLQTIQFSHYPDISNSAKVFRTDPDAAAALEQHMFQVQEIWKTALKSAKALPTVAGLQKEQLDWVNRLKAAIDTLGSALDRSDEDVAAAVRSLKEMVAQQPPRINSRLTYVAEELPLGPLIDTLEDVIKAADDNDPAAGDLQNGLRSLQNLLPQFKGTVEEHKQWQEIENEFLGTDDFIEQGNAAAIEEFKELWPWAKNRVETLAQANPNAKWVILAREQSRAIDRDFPDNMVPIRTVFKAYRRTVLFHFFQVDRSLRSQCEAILEIRQPLRSLLAQVKDDDG